MLMPNDPYKYLAAAMLLQAVKDAAAGDLEARIWLLTGGQLFLDALGIGMDPDRMRAWFDAGCPSAVAMQVKGARVKSPLKSLALMDG